MDFTYSDNFYKVEWLDYFYKFMHETKAYFSFVFVAIPYKEICAPTFFALTWHFPMIEQMLSHIVMTSAIFFSKENSTTFLSKFHTVTARIKMYE